MTSFRAWSVVLSLTLLAPVVGRAQTVLTHDQVSFIDLDLNTSSLSNPTFVVTANDRTTDTIYSPVFISGLNRWVFNHNSGVRFLVQDPHLYLRPASSAWNFIGVGPLEPFRATPQNGNPATHLILSVSTIDFPTNVFTNDQINITLSTAGITNPGHFSMYTNDDPFNDATGNLDTVYLSTLNSLFSFSRFAGTANNFNLAFSAPGTYQLDFQFSGTMTEELGGASVVSDVYRYTFVVAAIPEPATWAMIAATAALATGGLVHYRRRRRQLTNANL